MEFSSYMMKAKKLLQNPFFQILLFGLLAALSYAMLVSNVKPEKIDVQLLEVSEETIRSPKTVEDTVKTEQEQEEAVKQVADVYVLKQEYAKNRVDLLSNIFASAAEVQTEKAAAENGEEKDEGDGSKNQDAVLLELVAAMKQKLTDDVNKNLSEKTYRELVTASESELSIAEDSTITAVNKIMNNRILNDEVEEARDQVEKELANAPLNSDLKAAAVELGRYGVTANYFFDKSKTVEQQEKAKDSVEPVMILQGQILVEKGELVDQEVYNNLKLAGLLETENSPYPFIGLGLLILLIFGFMFYYYRVFEGTFDQKNNHILIFSIVFLISVTFMKAISLISNTEQLDLSFFVPAAMGAMLLKTLLSDRFAVIFTIIICIFGAIIFNESIASNFNLTIALFYLISGLSAVLLLSTDKFKSKLLQTGLLLSFIHVITILALMYIQDIQLTRADYFLYILAAFTSALTSSVLTIGLMPLFETGFGILSPFKLLELSNPNHPLLRKILTDAPGTYHHSVMVANLAEAACEAIGANGLLARVGCYYHDLGKTKRPQFFIENQMNIDNPHDRLPPATSKDIIIAHVSDGVNILRKNKMPKDIIEIAEQHHGTTLLKYFYHKAKEAGLDVTEEEYRYPGPKARTKENAVIGIADSVEAAVRSMSHPTKEKIESLVKAIIRERINDNQFSECDITFKELEIVEKTLCQTLNGIFHSRIEYPESNNENKKV